MLKEHRPKSARQIFLELFERFFTHRRVDLQLRRRGIKTIVLGGISTNIGVESTARVAHEHGYSLVLVEDAMSCAAPEQHLGSLTYIFPRLGLVRQSSDVLEALADR